MLDVSMPRRVRVLLALLLGVLLVGGATQLGPFTEPASALAASPTRTPTTPWIGEATRLKGAIRPATRPIALQVYSSGAWRTLKTAKTGSSGAYSFTVKATTTRRAYRVKAPRATVNGRTYTAVTTGTTYVVGTRPVATVEISPVSAAGTLVGGGVTPVTVLTRPARAGSTVTLQVWNGSSWANISGGTGTTNAQGLKPFRVDVGTASSPRTLRAIARLTSGSTGYAGPSVKPHFWKTNWNDEFSGSSLSSAWTHRDVDVRSGRRICSTTGTAQTTVNNGAAHLRLKRDLIAARSKTDCPYGTYRNAMVGTETSHKFVYGVFSARVRFQPTGGMHGASWLQAVGTPEIDTAEYFGDGRTDGGVAHFVHPHPSTGLPSVGGINARTAAYFKALGTKPSSGYHIYSVQRTAAGYVFRVDGVEMFRTSAARSTDPIYPVLSLLASDWEIPRIDQSRLAEAAMHVDWVRVWTP